MRGDGSQWLLVTESWVGWSRIEGLGGAWDEKKRKEWEKSWMVSWIALGVE